MPAWIAGIKVRKDAFGDIDVNLVPALHVGMTDRGGLLELTVCISKEGTRKETLPQREDAKKA